MAKVGKYRKSPHNSHNHDDWKADHERRRAHAEVAASGGAIVDYAAPAWSVPSAPSTLSWKHGVENK